MKRAGASPWRIFAAPLAIAAATIAGLVAALLGEGWPDRVSWLGLLVPVAVIVWAALGRRV